MRSVFNVMLGFFMAMADGVPGVSGGTIAFIMGYYDRLISSLYNLVKGNSGERKKSAVFLIKLFIGWVIGFSIIIIILGNIMHTHVYELCSLFLGLSLFSLPIIIKQEWNTFKGQQKWLVLTLLGTCLVCAITIFRVTNHSFGMDVNAMSVSTSIYVIICAGLAMTAMVLPGLSGSSILLILGLYMPVISAAKGILHGEMQHLGLLMLYAAGVIIGVFFSISFIKNLLEKHRPQTMYLIVGLVIGSLYSIVEGPATLNVPKAPMGASDFHVVFFLAGGAAILMLDWLKRKVRKLEQNKSA